MARALLVKLLICWAFAWQASCAPVPCPAGHYYDPSGGCVKCPDRRQPPDFLKAVARAHSECRLTTATEAPETTAGPTHERRHNGAAASVWPTSSATAAEAGKNVRADVSTATDGNAAPSTEQRTEPPKEASTNWMLALAMCLGAALAIGAAVIYACCPSLRSRLMDKIRYLIVPGRQAASDINLQTPEAQILMSPASDSNQPNPTLPIKPEPSMTGVPTIPRVDTA